MDREFEPNPQDEREVDLADETELPPPPATIDPHERVEEPLEDDNEDIPLDDERPV